MQTVTRTAFRVNIILRPKDWGTVEDILTSTFRIEEFQRRALNTLIHKRKLRIRGNRYQSASGIQMVVIKLDD